MHFKWEAFILLMILHSLTKNYYLQNYDGSSFVHFTRFKIKWLKITLSFTERHLRNRKSCWDKRENILKNKIPLFQWSINQKPQSPQAYSDSRTITTNSTNPPLTKYLKKKKKELPKNQTNQLVNRYAKSNSKTSYDTLFPLLDLMENKESGEGTRTSFPSRR